MTSSRDTPVPDTLLSLLDESDDAIFTLDHEGRFSYVNPATAAIVRLTPADLIGKSLEQDFPYAFNARWLSASREARETRRSVSYDAFNPALGGPVHVHITASVTGLAVRIRNVTQHHRTVALQHVTAALAGAGTTDDVVRILIHQAVTAAGAYMGALVVPTADRAHLALVADVGYTPELREKFARFPLTLGIPPCDAARHGVPVFVSGEEFDHQYPESVGVRAERTRSLAALPLLVDGGVWGVLALSFQDVRHFDEGEQLFLRALVQQSESALTRVVLHARQQTQADRLATLNRVGRVVSGTLDLNALVQTVTDAGVELTGAAFGAFFYNVVGDRQETYTLYTLSGVSREAFERFPMPRSTRVFGVTFAGQGVLRSADITRDARYGHNAPYHGMPEGHLPVRSYLAVPVMARSGEVLGGLFFGHPDADVFTEEAEHLAVGLAAQTAVALDNASLYRQLQASHAGLESRVLERTRELDEERAALDAFAAFTERSATTTDVRELARNAVQVLQAALGDVSVAYYERTDGRWKAEVLSGDIPPEVRDVATAGFPIEPPSFARAVAGRDVLFVEEWDAEAEHVEAAHVYGAVALSPYVLNGSPFALLTMGSSVSQHWTARERGVFRAVARSLGLAFERAERTSQLEAQNVELTLRTRALEAFAELTRNFSLDADRDVLVRRAQSILLSLLGDGYVLYWRPEGPRWRNTSLVGSLGDPTLESMVAQGVPRGAAPMLELPWETQRAIYQDDYARAAQTDAHTEEHAHMVRHVGAVAMLPVTVGAAPHGVIGLGLFERRAWTGADRAVLETVARSLGLALEGAQSALALRDRTAALERSNQELEKFAFVASHDLQEPLRTVASFSELIGRRHGDALDDRGRTYLSLITRSAERMKTLIDELLLFSRLNTVQAPLVAVPLHDVLDDALLRLRGSIDHAGAAVHVGPLPEVLGSRSELVQLFQNLIGNAVKFRRPGVAPDVRVSAHPHGESSWRVQITDNGQGFDPKFAERIFELFQRLHRRDDVEGSGMGLAIVRKIAEHHGGHVWAESVPGSGSTFHVVLPDVTRGADR